MKIAASFFIGTLLLAQGALGQAANGRRSIDFETYNPPSSLVVPGKVVTKAKFPFIDVHNHQYNMPNQDLVALLRQMDTLNMKVMVNLSGRGFRNTNGVFDVNDHQYLVSAVANAKKATPNRLVVFTNVSFAGVGEKGWADNAVAQLEADVKAGAKGLKVYKNLGFSFKDTDGKMLRVDDPRLDPVWAACGRLGIPVLIHTADPKQFWDDTDDHNERLLELLTNPGRKRSDTDPAPWADLIQQQHNIIKRHPKTNFIAAHFGWYPNDLAHLGTLLDAMPNMYVEFGAVIAELGRQPRMAKQFFNKYQDRILFGKDSWVPAEYATYFRVLETEDEYFPYHKKYHAFWPMYGMGLSDEVLKKVYYKNALKLIPGLDASLFPK
ncbi:amidohydrolase family protein [Paracnuella aquatica]|uniref:amidohydrolase family protein n=1 Tax=Paracnuella aquatica TaxID=2268757 RepID=UPI000DEF0F30|nr:amidohydrolase family protein [Paracnuella aquatica]RPD50843.1 amidohydrolase [Paracnuella aquatica]